MYVNVFEYKTRLIVFAEVDCADFEIVSGYRWRQDSKGYAVSGRNNYMARMLLGVTERSQYVDHIDGNPLNNKRSNLRIASNSQNQANRKLLTLNTSGYRGVTWNKRSNKWQAGIKRYGKSYHLGLFESPKDAYEAYKSAAETLFGEYAQHLSEAA